MCHYYPNMGWSWKLTNPPIHIYCKVVWEHKYRTAYHKICYYFLAPLYQFIFDSPTPCMTDKALEIVQKIGYLYLLEHGTYIRVYGATKAPHFLPRFVPNNLVLQEVEYQITIHGVGATLYRDKKAIFPPLPFMGQIILLQRHQIVPS
jgi:hypothetical protein